MTLHIVDGRPVDDAGWFAELEDMARDEQPQWPDFRPSDRFIGCDDDEPLPIFLQRQAG